jgi:tetratricopeptide (TPR) repeat protein
MNLASALDNIGETDAAIAEYRESIRLDPNNAETHYNLGISLAKKRDGPGVLSELRASEKLDPDWPIPHIWLVTLLMKPDPRGALDECRIADKLTHDPKMHELCEKLAAQLK